MTWDVATLDSHQNENVDYFPNEETAMRWAVQLSNENPGVVYAVWLKTELVYLAFNGEIFKKDSSFV